MNMLNKFVGVVLLTWSPFVAAIPFSITYNGTAAAAYYGEPMVPGIFPGPYSVRLVFDNGGTTAVSQTWTGSHLTCVIWTFNGGSAKYAQDLVANPPDSRVGSVVTNGSGSLTSVFSNVRDNATSSTGYTVRGFTPTDPVSWYANSMADVFYTDTWDNAVGDSAGGVNGIQMITANWSNPTPFNEPCSALTAEPVPTLGEWAMLLLASLMAMFGYARLRASYAGGRG